MKTLIVLRHAKTEADAVDDWHRNLTDRGRAQARSLGPDVAELGLDDRLVVLVSTALRAAQTWDEIQPALGPEVVVRETPALYAFDEDEILQVLREVDEDEEVIMIVGHNPGLSDLVVTLTGEELPDDRAVAKYGQLRTCRGAVLEYDGLWCDIDSKDCSTQQYLSPGVD
ncbi:histidine phosphatase family protein [Blastococcus sp. Marseille-P5729]|uniref:SixA phosphatase family protein n=1 Tax=Blastococcus sp. Marseille-P5729 TaxID=2086582 RepID=UPI00131BCFA2|nr:histidine phosphatase family protein [Blastococcus sp. Marseille-P5729]